MDDQDKPLPEYVGIDPATPNVKALKMIGVDQSGDLPKVHFANTDYPPRKVAVSTFNRSKAAVGDWYVVYDDGVESTLPDKTFKELYKGE